MPFHYETMCTLPHNGYAKYQTVNKGLERDAIFGLTHLVLDVGAGVAGRGPVIAFLLRTIARELRKPGATSIKIIS